MVTRKSIYGQPWHVVVADDVWSVHLPNDMYGQDSYKKAGSVRVLISVPGLSSIAT